MKPNQRYRCGTCRKEVVRRSSKQWIKSYCEQSGKNVRLMAIDKPKTGRPAPLGRKKPVGIRLTPDVLEFCKQHPDGFVFLESLCRKSREFKAWKGRKLE